MAVLEDWSLVGDRVRTARIAQGLSQADLADALAIPRTAVVRIEQGERRLSLLEAAALADRVAVDVATLIADAPPAVTSHRQAPVDETERESGRARASLLVEQHARDTAWLIEHGHLVVPARLTDQHHVAAVPTTASGAETAARAIRRSVGLTALEPVGGMADVAERMGTYLVAVDEPMEGASIDMDGWGAAIVGAQQDPGRRRMTAAHEIGHYVLGDAYSVDLGVSASTDDRERIIDRFAAELLLPGVAVIARLTDVDDVGLPDAVLALAAEYRVSWRAAVERAFHAGMVSAGQRTELRLRSPTRGDLLRVTGGEVTEDLAGGAAGPQWTRAVLDAYAAGDIESGRALRLLHGRFAADQLPSRDDDDLW
jgi:Zn-dependent peptidase ImmA (M78 family)/transcriptional regulator with XRE-family HTH domain